MFHIVKESSGAIVLRFVLESDDKLLFITNSFEAAKQALQQIKQRDYN